MHDIWKELKHRDFTVQRTSTKIEISLQNGTWSLHGNQGCIPDDQTLLHQSDLEKCGHIN